MDHAALLALLDIAGLELGLSGSGIGGFCLFSGDDIVEVQLHQDIIAIHTNA